MQALQGVTVAALTPRREGPEIDMAAAFELLDFLGKSGVQGISLLGSTGEFAHFEAQEKSRFLSLCARRSRLPILAGVSHSTLDGAVALGREAADAGVAGLMLMPPYFFQYGQEDIREFYLAFARELGDAAPIYLYNVPAFTSAIAPGTATELLRTGLFAGIKDSSARWDMFLHLRAFRASNPFTLLVGSDLLYPAARLAGADGVVSGVACALPELLVALDKAVPPARDRLESRLQEFLAWLERFPTPVAIREAVHARGMRPGPHAAPLAGKSARDAAEFREWFLGWLPGVIEECRA